MIDQSDFPAHEFFGRKCSRKIDEMWFSGFVTDVIPFTDPPVLVIKYDDDNKVEEIIYEETNDDFRFIIDFNDLNNGSISANSIQRNKLFSDSEISKLENIPGLDNKDYNHEIRKNNDDDSVYSSVISNEMSSAYNVEIDISKLNLNDINNDFDYSNNSNNFTRYKNGVSAVSSLSNGISTEFSSDAFTISYQCGFCSKLTVYRCNGCNNVYYCSRKCQRRGWRKHKKVCTFTKKEIDESLLPTRSDLSLSKSLSSSSRIDNRSRSAVNQAYVDSLEESSAQINYKPIHSDSMNGFQRSDSRDSLEAHACFEGNDDETEDNDWDKARKQGWNNTHVYSNSMNVTKRQKPLNNLNTGNSSGNDSGSCSSDISDDNEVEQINKDLLGKANLSSNNRPQLKVHVPEEDDLYGQRQLKTYIPGEPTMPANYQGICHNCIDGKAININNKDYTGDIKYIQEIIQVPEAQIIEALRLYYGNVEASVNYLLNNLSNDEPPPLEPVSNVIFNNSLNDVD